MFDGLKFEESGLRPSGIQIADYADAPVEVKVLHLAKGAKIPKHSHSDSVTHLVVAGELDFGGVRYPAGTDYVCGRFEYQGMAIKESYVLLVQPPGTVFDLGDQA